MGQNGGMGSNMLDISLSALGKGIGMIFAINKDNKRCDIIMFYRRGGVKWLRQ